MVTRIPNQRLVYLHCASIFKGDRAQIRKLKKVTEVLTRYRKSIKTLTNEFSLATIAPVAKALLDREVFASEARAKLHFPELFQPSETQEAEREASEAEAARIEAEAVQEAIVTSDEECEEELLNTTTSQGQGLPSHAAARTIEGSARDVPAEQDNVPQSKKERDVSQRPRLHPVYLPVRTQHQILTLVQSILEGCCFQFGNTWVPELMKAQKWEEAESIELTRWNQIFSKCTKDLPLSATTSIAGKGLKEVLFATSNLRHSAVHRLNTSAAGILKLLEAAIIFTEALNDTERATCIRKINDEVAAIVDDIVQHQTLLERKLSDQLNDFARKRAEIDDLERVAIEDVLENDKTHRGSAGSVVEGFLANLTKAAQASPSEKESKEEDQEGASGAAQDALSDEDCNGEEEDLDETNAATHPDLLDQLEDGPPPEDCPGTEDPPVYNHYPAEYDTAEGRFVSNIGIDNPQADEVGVEPDPVEPDYAVADHIIPSAPSLAESNAQILEEPIAVDDGYSYIPTAEEPPPVPVLEEQVEADSAGPPSVYCPPTPPILVGASSAEPEDTEKYAVVLKIPHGSEFLMTMVCLGSATRTAILNEAEEIYAERVLKCEPQEKGWERTCTRRLLTVTMEGHEVDMSAFASEDLTFLVERISKSGIPMFTVEIS